MIFFIDSANLHEIKAVNDLGIVGGVTTNPSLMAKEGISGTNSILNHYKKICNIVDGDISAEVISTKFEEIVDEGHKLSEIDKKIIVKIPIIEDGLKAIHYFSKKKIKTNCTLVFSASQALLAAKAGATYVSPFMGRLDDWDKKTCSSLDMLSDIKTIYKNYNYNTKILGASIRNQDYIIKCAKIGADVITAPFKSLISLINHPLTDSGLKKFIEDYHNSNSQNR
tara:strand:+ start:697 stop:1371 length:675 start_codon:yes stop_codon:yes gene_type:complete